MKFFTGFFVGVACCSLLIASASKYTKMYREGIEDAYKDAYENGLAVRTINEKDEVVYSWKELHKIGYED